MLPPGPSLKCWPLRVSAHKSVGPWLPVLPLGPPPPRSTGPWLPVLPPGSPQECQPLTAGAAPWSPTGVLALDCQFCPLVPHVTAGPWLPVLPPAPPPPPHRSADPWLPVLPLGPYTGVLTLGCQYCPLDAQPVFRMLRIVQLSPQTLLMCVLLLSVWFSAHKGPCSSGTAGHQQHRTSGLTQPRTCRAAHFVHGKSTRKNSVLSSAGFFSALYINQVFCPCVLIS